MERTNSAISARGALAITTGVLATGAAIKLDQFRPAVWSAITSLSQKIFELKDPIINSVLSSKEALVQTASDHYIAIALGTAVTLTVALKAKDHEINPENKPKRDLSTIASDTGKLVLLGASSVFANTALISASPMIADGLNTLRACLLPADEIAAKFIQAMPLIVPLATTALFISLIIAKTEEQKKIKSDDQTSPSWAYQNHYRVTYL